LSVFAISASSSSSVMGKLGALRAMRKAWNGLKAVVIRVNVKDHIAKRKQSVRKPIKRKTKKSFAKNVGLLLKHSSHKPVLRIDGTAGKRSVDVSKRISHRRFLPTHVVTHLIPQSNPLDRQFAYGFHAHEIELEVAGEDHDQPKPEMEPISSSQNDHEQNEEESKDVDKQAEDFINNFRRDIKLQRQRSIGEYHEMLARGIG